MLGFVFEQKENLHYSYLVAVYFLFLISSPGSSIVSAFCFPSLSKDDMRSASQSNS